MPVFEYAGIDRNRKKAGGIIEAESDKAARAKLRKLGVYPQSLNIAGAKSRISLSGNIDLSAWLQRIKTEDIAMMTRQLSTLINAGIPLVEALTALLDQIENIKLRKVLSQLREKVTEGMKLSDAMRAHAKIFSPLYINMVNAGESSGALDVVLSRLADFTENQAKLQGKVKGAMMYPVIMTVVAFGLMILLMVGVVPKITAMLLEQGKALPLPTQIVVFLSNLFSSIWFFVFLFAFIPTVVYGVKRWLATEKGRWFWHQKVLNLPLVGRITRMVAISRFTRTLSTLLSSGVPLLQGMEIVKNIVSNVVIRNAIEETAASVKEGQSISEPLKKSGHFPPIVTHMIAIGEKTGDLEKMLERIADNYDTQVNNTLSAMTTILEPVMILVMAGGVGFIVMAVLLPILDFGFGEGV